MLESAWPKNVIDSKAANAELYEWLKVEQRDLRENDIASPWARELLEDQPDSAGVRSDQVVNKIVLPSVIAARA